MMHTKTEAGEKWCPFVRAPTAWFPPDAPAGTVAAAAGNRDYHDSRCIGPGCMAWRWQGGAQHSDRQLGYCGLAGRP